MRQEQQLFPRQNASVLSALRASLRNCGWAWVKRAHCLAAQLKLTAPASLWMSCEAAASFPASTLPYFSGTPPVCLLLYTHDSRAHGIAGRTADSDTRNNPLLTRMLWNWLLLEWNPVFGEKRERLSGENIPEGVTIARDHPCVTSETLLPPSQTMEACRSSGPKTLVTSGKEKPYGIHHLPQNIKPSTFRTTSMCQDIRFCKFRKHNVNCKCVDTCKKHLQSKAHKRSKGNKNVIPTNEFGKK